MPRLTAVRSVLVLVLVTLGCRGDGRAPDRNPVQPVQQPGAPVQSAPATPAPPAAGESPPPTNEPPPGDDKVGAPPKALADKIALEDIAHGLKRPVLIVVAPNDPRRRMFIVEQRSGIRFLENGKLSPKPFFAWKDLSTGNEQGMLGLAFHPKFQTNGKLYIYYTAKDDTQYIVEYKVGSDPDAVDMSTRREIMKLPDHYSNHNGGHVVFGPDGKLYTGTGDSGAANDPKQYGQNPTTLFSKILRFDVDAAKPEPEIVHMGLRNPWRFSFDPDTGDLFIGDVGQNLWEYIFAVRGGDKRKHNFGWSVLEGSHCFNRDTGGGKKSCDKTGFTLPVAEYSHDEGCSITGGMVYRGKALPDLVGHYFYADYCTGLLRSFRFPSGYAREHYNWKPAIDRQAVVTQVSSFGVDHDGELYIVELTGSIYKLVPKR